MLHPADALPPVAAPVTAPGGHATQRPATIVAPPTQAQPPGVAKANSPQKRQAGVASRGA